MIKMGARRHQACDPELQQILNLIRSAFHYMEKRIDPPSSIHKLTINDLETACRNDEVWSIGDPILACMVLTVKPDVLNMGRLAVDAAAKRQGYGKQLVDIAINRARALDKPTLEIFTRIELLENQTFFKALGFVITTKRSHAGYDKPTFVVMHRPVNLDF